MPLSRLVLRMRLLLLLAAGLLAGACNTTASRVEQRSADEARCRAYGFRPATDAFAKCLLQLDLDRAEDRRVRSDYPYVHGPRGWGWYRGWW